MNSVLKEITERFDSKALVEVGFAGGLKNRGRIVQHLKDGFILESDEYPTQIVLIDNVTTVGLAAERATRRYEYPELTVMGKAR